MSEADASSLVVLSEFAWREYERGHGYMHPALWALWQLKARVWQTTSNDPHHTNAAVP